jgi:hypothetical protein
LKDRLYKYVTTDFLNEIRSRNSDEYKPNKTKFLFDFVREHYSKYRYDTNIDKIVTYDETHKVNGYPICDMFGLFDIKDNEDVRKIFGVLDINSTTEPMSSHKYFTTRQMYSNYLKSKSKKTNLINALKKEGYDVDY